MARPKPPAPPLSTHRPVLDFVTFALALIGILVVVHLWIQSGRGFDRGCFGFSAPASVDPTFNCEAVINSDAGKLLGVSNVIWGLGFYLLVAALSFLVLLRKGAALKNVKSIRALILAGGLMYSGYLSYVQYFQLGDFCKLCLISASIVALLFIVLLVEYFTKPEVGRADDPDSFLRKVPVFGAMVGLIALVTVADVAYFNGLKGGSDEPVVTAEVNPAAEGEAPVAVCQYDPEKARVENYLDMVSFSDPSKGNPDASVVVVEFFDPNCPHCKTMNPVMDAIVRDYGDRARFVYRPFVVFPQSMVQVEALYASAREGKFFEMLEGQFERQTTRALTMDEIQEIAAEAGLNWDLLKHRLDNRMFRSVAVRHSTAASEAGITSVPAVMINGRVVKAESRTVPCLKELIDRANLATS